MNEENKRKEKNVKPLERVLSFIPSTVTSILSVSGSKSSEERIYQDLVEIRRANSHLCNKIDSLNKRMLGNDCESVSNITYQAGGIKESDSRWQILGKMEYVKMVELCNILNEVSQKVTLSVIETQEIDELKGIKNSFMFSEFRLGSLSEERQNRGSKINISDVERVNSPFGFDESSLLYNKRKPLGGAVSLPPVSNKTSSNDETRKKDSLALVDLMHARDKSWVRSLDIVSSEVKEAVK